MPAILTEFQKLLAREVPAARCHTQQVHPGTGGPRTPVWLPEGKVVSHRQARSGHLFPGKGKEGKRGNQKAWRRARGGGALIFPGPPWLASCPSSCKIFFPELLTRGAPRAGRGLHQGLVQGAAGDRDRGMGWWEGGSWGQEGAKEGRLCSRPCVTSNWSHAALPWLCILSFKMGVTVTVLRLLTSF